MPALADELRTYLAGRRAGKRLVRPLVKRAPSPEPLALGVALAVAELALGVALAVAELALGVAVAVAELTLGAHAH